MHMRAGRNTEDQQVRSSRNTPSITSLYKREGAPQDDCVRHIWDANSGKFVPFNESPAPVKFLKGPIPWAWIVCAAALPGHALATGLCIWRLAGATRASQIKLSNKECELLGVTRYAKSRALKSLEAAGLIAVEHRRGRFPRVSIIPVEPNARGGDARSQRRVNSSR